MLDQLISKSIVQIQSESLTKLMILITNIGDKYTLAFLSLILLIFLIRKKEYTKSKLFALVMASGVILSQTIKRIVVRARPETQLIPESIFSFPSGHTTLSVAFFGMMIYLFKDKIKNKTTRYLFIIANIILILAISFSRLYLNVHWATDVLAGLTLGLVCIVGSIWAIKNIPALKKVF